MTRDEIIAMTKDEIITLTRKAGMPDWKIGVGSTGEITGYSLEQLERFAALVAEKERSACAQVCERLALGTRKAQSGPADALENVMLRQVATLGHSECAIAIRKRGKTC